MLRSDRLTVLLLLPLLATGCAPAPSGDETAQAPAAPAPAAEPTFAESFAAAVEGAFGAEAWRAHEAVEARVSVTFGGNPMLEGKMLFTTDMGKVRIELADGTVAVFDGGQAWVSPADSAFQGARFHLLTWPYFLAVPAKLQDPGTQLEDLGTEQIQDTTYDAARLTFDAGVGDSPDDWYIVYRDPDSDRLAAMAYIVTYHASLEEAEKEPHAITYGDFRPVQGVEVPHHWQFWMWSEEEGIHGDPIGEATLGEVRFLTPPEGSFSKPEDAREDQLPAAGQSP